MPSPHATAFVPIVDVQEAQDDSLFVFLHAFLLAKQRLRLRSMTTVLFRRLRAGLSQKQVRHLRTSFSRYQVIGTVFVCRSIKFTYIPFN